MRVSVAIMMVVFVCGIPAFAGTIAGNVHAEGKAGAEGAGNASDDADGAYSSRKYKFVPKVDYSAMHDFVIYVEGHVGTNSPAVTNVVTVETRRIAQHGALFSPHVLPIVAGTTVEWPNDDDIYHNV